MGRSRGGLTTKIHALVDALGRPIRLKLTAGQAHYGRSAADMFDSIQAEQILLADRACDSDALRETLDARGACAHHCAGGGLTPDGTRWIGCRPGFFLPVKVLSRLFRRLLLESLAKLHKAGKLAFFGNMSDLADPDTFEAHLLPLRKIEWVV